MKKFLIFAVCVLSGVAVFAQHRYDDRRAGFRGDRCEAICLHFAESCRLNDEEVAKFKEIYKDYYEELQTIREKYRMERRRDLSDEEVESQMKGKLECSKKIAELKEKYYDKFKTVLTPRQIARLYDDKDGFYRNGERHFKEYYRRGDVDCYDRDCYGGGHHRGCCNW